MLPGPTRDVELLMFVRRCRTGGKCATAAKIQGGLGPGRSARLIASWSPDSTALSVGQRQTGQPGEQSRAVIEHQFREVALEAVPFRGLLCGGPPLVGRAASARGRSEGSRARPGSPVRIMNRQPRFITGALP
jgi:hypothetical protein